MSAATATKLSLAEIRVAYARIEQHIHRTPVLTSKTFDTLSGGLQLFFKCENLQKTGAFKARGACNAVLKAKADLGDGLKGNLFNVLFYHLKELKTRILNSEINVVPFSSKVSSPTAAVTMARQWHTPALSHRFRARWSFPRTLHRSR